MKIIGICGFKRSGKDTVANYISKNYDYVHKKISQPLKDIIHSLFGMNCETDKETINEQWNITSRKAMEFIGTEIFQYKIQELLPDIQRNFWIKSLLDNNNDNKIVLSDLRFQHEIDYIKSRNIDLKIIKIIRFNNINMDVQHISEKEYVNFEPDYIIYNDGDLDKLYKNIDEFLSK
jgi:dephospho-CoA kinase